MFSWKKIPMKKVRPQIDRELNSLLSSGNSFEFPLLLVDIFSKWSFIRIYNYQDDKLINSDDKTHLSKK